MTWQNFLESFYDFFGRRIQGGLIDEIRENTKFVGNYLIEHPCYSDNRKIKLNNNWYMFEVLGSDLLENYDYAPTVIVKRIVKNCGREKIKNLIVINYLEDDVKLEYIDQRPIGCRSIRTKNQLNKFFNWTDADLLDLYKYLSLYITRIL